MSVKYSAFTFCDRIVDIVPARSARAIFWVPKHVATFAPCLVAEAVGQLAAWVAMSHIEFRGRPVAALAGSTRFLGGVEPGQTLELEVEVEQCDDEAVAYGGHAAVEGRDILELRDCVGPMLPQAEYDDPADLARQFRLLCADGATPGRFEGVVAPPLVTIASSDVQQVCRLDVPEHASFFADHFPRRPVFPATLLLDGAMRAACDFVDSTVRRGESFRPVRTSNVKMRDFVLPRQSVTLTIDLKKATDEALQLALNAAVGDRTVATARIEFATVRVTA